MMQRLVIASTDFNRRELHSSGRGWARNPLSNRLFIVAGLIVAATAWVIIVGIFVDPYGAGASNMRILRFGMAIVFCVGVPLTLFVNPRPWSTAFFRFLALVAFVAVVNVLASSNPLMTSALWLGLALSWVCWYQMSNRVGPMEFSWLVRIFGVGILVIAVAIATIYSHELGTASQRMQSLSFYCGALFFVAMVYQRMAVRLTLAGIAVFGLFASSSRGAVLCVFIGIIAGLVAYRRPSIRLLMSCLAIVSAMIVGYRPVVEFTTHFFGRKISEGRDASAVEALNRSASDRFHLAQRTINLMWRNPLGLGLGEKYMAGDSVEDSGAFYTPHNGILSTGLETGLPGYCICGLLVFRSLYGLRRLRWRYAGLRAKLVAFIVFITSRSLMENYFILNAGNLVVFCFMLIMLYFAFGFKRGAGVRLGGGRAQAVMRRGGPQQWASRA